MRPARVLAGAGAVVLATLVAVAAGSLPGREAPAPRATAGPPASGPLGGVPLARPTHLRLLVAGDPAPFVVDLDRNGVRPVTGLPSGGGRVVSVLPAGRDAVIVAERTCDRCRRPAREVYGIRRGGTTAVRLGTAEEVAAARDGRAAWLLGRRTATSCVLREVGLQGRPRRPPRPVPCSTKLLGELPAGLLVATGPSKDPWERPVSLLDRRGRRTRLGLPAADLLAATGRLVLTGAEPLAPLTLTDVGRGTSWRLAWPSRLRGGTHIAAVHPNGRDIAVGFHGLAAPGEDGYDLWLLDTVGRRWRHLPDLPAADVAAKATDMAWTPDGRLVVLTGTAGRGRVVAVWRPGQPRLALRPLRLPEPSPGTDTLAVWGTPATGPGRCRPAELGRSETRTGCACGRRCS